jgi:hypothetical protein
MPMLYYYWPFIFLQLPSFFMPEGRHAFRLRCADARAPVLPVWRRRCVFARFVCRSDAAACRLSNPRMPALPDVRWQFAFHQQALPAFFGYLAQLVSRFFSRSAFWHRFSGQIRQLPDLAFENFLRRLSDFKTIFARAWPTVFSWYRLSSADFFVSAEAPFFVACCRCMLPAMLPDLRRHATSRSRRAARFRCADAAMPDAAAALLFRFALRRYAPRLRLRA